MSLFVLSSDEAYEHPHVVPGTVRLDCLLQGLAAGVLVRVGNVGQVNLEGKKYIVSGGTIIFLPLIWRQ